ncbi:MAG: ornithine--oxo-acid transaminase [Legionellales bacterium]|nr:ornithine--oxo-acid transaminase [Legionellales bacterium]
MKNELIEMGEKYSTRHVLAAPLLVNHGQGVYVYDQQGRAYLDMVSGISVANFGHSHPRLIQTLIEQAQKIAIVPRLFHNEPLNRLLAWACELTGMQQALPMSTGAEIVETAIKVARKWGYLKKQVAIDAAEIIVCDNSFHGRTVTAVSMSTVEQYRHAFGPLTPGFRSIPFGDVTALAQAIGPNTVAFLVEPIQGEAGVIIPPAGYLTECAKLCREQNVLFLCDEIQTGMGRTGKFLAVDHEQVQPDGILLGKALGGGLLPISLLVGRQHWLEVLEPGDHGGTFGGNPLAAQVALTALTLLLENDLIEHVQRMGNYFIEQLTRIESPAVKQVRGKGLLIAIELNTDAVDCQSVVGQLLEHGLLAINTRNHSIRLLPALIVESEQIDAAVALIEKVLKHSTC